MQLELIKSSENRYKIITKSTIKHEALDHLADLLRESNKRNDIKIGIYSVSGGSFSLYKRIYSYISGRAESMTKTRFYRFIRGEVQMKPRKVKAMWKPAKKGEWKEIEEVMELVD